jgi:hypothetical protein
VRLCRYSAVSSTLSLTCPGPRTAKPVSEEPAKVFPMYEISAIIQTRLRSAVVDLILALFSALHEALDINASMDAYCS